MHKFYLRLSGIYFWSKGISPENNKAFSDVVTDFCKSNDITLSETNQGVLEGKIKGDLWIYFHPMETVFVGKVDSIFTTLPQLKEMFEGIGDVTEVTITEYKVTDYDLNKLK
jgi:hypothetical protein